MISIVCVYNDKHLLETLLLQSLSAQKTDHELILVDNRNGEFSSAAEALNSGGSKCKGEFILFVHQDVAFTSANALNQIETMIRELPRLGAAGVAGKSKATRGRMISNITHGSPAVPVCPYHLDRPVVVQTIDECVICVPREVFQAQKFDQETCRGWHLYGVDFWLSVQKKGLSVYVIPADVHHASVAHSFNAAYFDDLRRVLRKQRSDYRRIYTTMGIWSTRWPVRLQSIWHGAKAYAGPRLGRMRPRRKSG